MAGVVDWTGISSSWDWQSGGSRGHTKGLLFAALSLVGWMSGGSILFFFFFFCEPF